MGCHTQTCFPFIHPSSVTQPCPSLAFNSLGFNRRPHHRAAHQPHATPHGNPASLTQSGSISSAACTPLPRPPPTPSPRPGMTPGRALPCPDIHESCAMCVTIRTHAPYPPLATAPGTAPAHPTYPLTHAGAAPPSPHHKPQTTNHKSQTPPSEVALQWWHLLTAGLENARSKILTHSSHTPLHLQGLNCDWQKGQCTIHTHTRILLARQEGPAKPWCSPILFHLFTPGHLAEWLHACST